MNYTLSINDGQAVRIPQTNTDTTNRGPKLLTAGRVSYNCHISLRSSLFSKRFKYYGLTYALGGSCVRLEATNYSAYDELKNKLKMDNEKTGEGEVSKIKETAESKRGKVSTFSFRSRRRLLTTFAKLDKTRLKKPKMLTLTYPASYSDKWEKWKRDLDVFVSKHLLTRIPDVFIMWKLEPQKRGAPHYHLMIFSDCQKALEKVYQLKDTWKRVWYEIVASNDPKHLKAGTHVGFNSNKAKRKTKFDSWQDVTGYMGKYMGKTHEGFKDHLGNPIQYSGRSWGIYNREMYNKFVDEQYVDLNIDQFKELKKEIVKELIEDMDASQEMHRFKIQSKHKVELKKAIAEFDRQYDCLRDNVELKKKERKKKRAMAKFDTQYDYPKYKKEDSEGQIEIDIPDCYHFKRCLDIHKQKRAYQSKVNDDYGLFAFVDADKVVDICEKLTRKFSVATKRELNGPVVKYTEIDYIGIRGLPRTG